MTKEAINAAQEYLTVKGERKSQIVNVELLLRRHPSEYVVAFLKDLLKEKEVLLRDMAILDKTNPNLDRMIGEMFRVHMAIRTIEREEVKAA